MKLLQVEWREVNPKYGPVFHRGIVGQWQICTITMSMSRSGMYTLSVNLPGAESFKSYTSTKYNSVTLAKINAEEVFSRWFEKLQED